VVQKYSCVGSRGVPEPNIATELAHPWSVALPLRHFCRRGVLGYPYCGIRRDPRKRAWGFLKTLRGFSLVASHLIFFVFGCARGARFKAL